MVPPPFLIFIVQTKVKPCLRVLETNRIKHSGEKQKNHHAYGSFITEKHGENRVFGGWTEGSRMYPQGAKAVSPKKLGALPENDIGKV